MSKYIFFLLFNLCPYIGKIIRDYIHILHMSLYEKFFYQDVRICSIVRIALVSKIISLGFPKSRDSLYSPDTSPDIYRM